MTVAAKLTCKFSNRRTLNLLGVIFRGILMSCALHLKQLGCYLLFLIFLDVVIWSMRFISLDVWLISSEINVGTSLDLSCCRSVILGFFGPM